MDSFCEPHAARDPDIHCLSRGRGTHELLEVQRLYISWIVPLVPWPGVRRDAIGGSLGFAARLFPSLRYADWSRSGGGSRRLGVAALAAQPGRVPFGW